MQSMSMTATSFPPLLVKPRSMPAGMTDHIVCNSSEAARVRSLCAQLGITSARNGQASVHVLLAAIAQGRVSLSRDDDPYGRRLKLPAAVR